MLRARVLAVLKKGVPLHPTLHPTVAFSILETWIFLGGEGTLLISLVEHRSESIFSIFLNKHVPPLKSMSNPFFSCKLII